MLLKEYELVPYEVFPIVAMAFLAITLWLSEPDPNALDDDHDDHADTRW